MRPVSFTINSDASVHPRTGTAAYAYYIKGPDTWLRASGLLDIQTKHSGLAELLAISKALRRIREMGYEPKDVTIYINTDSKWAINMLLGKPPKRKDAMVVQAVRWIAKGYEIVPRHVKAHTDATDPRSYVNNWCDLAAKLAMRAGVA